MAFKRETTITKWVGNSEEPKPDGDIPVGSTFTETDTGRVYAYDGNQWTSDQATESLGPVLDTMLLELSKIRTAWEIFLDAEITPRA